LWTTSSIQGAVNVTNGTIKKLVPERGFGFIKGDDGEEYFFHRNEIENFDSLSGDEKVTFQVESGPKGPRAGKVQVTPA
jgi:CspA family cold shock protein